MEKKNIDGKQKKSMASIPANYVSILDLQERWMREKEGKQQQPPIGDEQRKREEYKAPMKVVEAMETGVKLEEKNLGGGFRRHCDGNRSRNESVDGEEPKCVEKDVSANGGNGGVWIEKKKKKKKKKKKPNQGGSVAMEIVKCESKASINPVKDKIWRIQKPNRENGRLVKDSVGVVTQFQDLCINKKVEEEGRDAKGAGAARLHNGRGYERNRRHDWSSTPVSASGSSMVWVKKGKNNGASGENGV